jgi:hypothetical protein
MTLPESSHLPPQIKEKNRKDLIVRARHRYYAPEASS